MFLLTETTLFFLNRALDARSNKKLALGGQVKTWAAGNAQVPGLELGQSAPSTVLGTTPATSVSARSSQLEETDSTHFGNNNFLEPFRDEVNNGAERADTVGGIKGKARQIAQIVETSESNDELDGEEFLTDAIRQVSKSCAMVSSSIKRKVVDTIEVSDSEPDQASDASDVMDIDVAPIPTPSDLDAAVKMINPVATRGKPGHLDQTSVSIIQTPQPPQKKIKTEQPDVSITMSSASQATRDAVEPSSGSHTNVKKTSTEIIKCRSDYSNVDLPVAANTVWLGTFINTMTLWISIQPDIWLIPEEDFVVALQTTFNAVYPQVPYTVTTQGSVYAIPLQQLLEWRSNIGSTALTMMIDFFAELDDNANIVEVAKALQDGYKFWQEDPDDVSPSCAYRSSFMLELLTSAYLSNVSGAINIPQWETKELLAGKDMESVIALCAAAVEHAVEFISDRLIDINEVLASMADNGGKMWIKLPKVLNKAMGKETSGPFMHLKLGNSNLGIPLIAGH
ncbi:hypothetical protein PAXRUDRAFT_27844 [Paxillus rubicundulus Ve08.2h10]|uniref:Uncharacterized protein n=1 Tax=Paxillus rubicundulus Ve08.2h10 TaxID=930991 RepID=A0A0D0CFQ7_9AGAM|nr:hypothetical protein PAXRUDRAFT_27844 [Paxillus rubicundulus Ve08.2h10]